MSEMFVFDVEVYPNYTLFAFMDVESCRVFHYEIRGEDEKLTTSERIALRDLLENSTIIGYNSSHYDWLIASYALKGATARGIHALSDKIIVGKLPPWKVQEHYGLKLIDNPNHYDLMAIGPGLMISLKLYGARIHAKRIQDLPIPPGTTLTKGQMVDIKRYCMNDLAVTHGLYGCLEESIELRKRIGDEFGFAAGTSTDAQIAEKIIKIEVQKMMPSKNLCAPKGSPSKTICYAVPSFIEFYRAETRAALDLIRNQEFKVNAKGIIVLPKEFSTATVPVGKGLYKLGIGGIHSTEKSQAVVPGEDQHLTEIDVASYYPAIILKLGLYPKQIGAEFLQVYRQLVDRRLEAKATGNKVEDGTLKIVINGCFGKMGSVYSMMYSPELLLSVTMTGQLSLLMLIEWLEDAGIQVVSANTDGVVALYGKSKHLEFDAVINAWQEATGFTLESSPFDALYSRDVNNYLALKPVGSKGKGIFSTAPLRKNPQGVICYTAVERHLAEGIAVEDTIRGCDDIRQFIHARTVSGGAVAGDVFLGRVARWVYTLDGQTIRYKNGGAKVPKADGCSPVPTLGAIPDDLDYDRYIAEAKEILKAVGVSVPKRKGDQSDLHVAPQLPFALEA